MSFGHGALGVGPAGNFTIFAWRGICTIRSIAATDQFSTRVERARGAGATGACNFRAAARDPKLLTFHFARGQKETMTSVRRTLGAFLAMSACVLGFGIACSSASLRPAGSGCSVDGDCAAGLSCLGIANFSDAGCTSIAKACSKVCRVDGDCTAVGAKFKCFAGCDATSTCGQTP